MGVTLLLRHRPSLRNRPGYILNQCLGFEVHYNALNSWHKLTAFLDHADLPLDNNPAEAAIRPFTIGRKNWVFAGSPRGADGSAFWYSLVETAKANGWEPRAYLTELFTRFPLAKTREEQRALLPMSLKTDTSAG